MPFTWKAFLTGSWVLAWHWEFHVERPLPCELSSWGSGSSLASNLVKGYEIGVVISARMPDQVTSFGWKEGDCPGTASWGQVETL